MARAPMSDGEVVAKAVAKKHLAVQAWPAGGTRPIGVYDFSKLSNTAIMYFTLLAKSIPLRSQSL